MSAQTQIPSTLDSQGQQVARTTLTPTSNQQPKVVLCKNQAYLPIVFLPGIMGSNLRDKTSKQPVWRPPNVILEGQEIKSLFAALAYWGRKDAADRQGLLDLTKLEVDDSGTIGIKPASDDKAEADPDRGFTEELARYRGWGTVWRENYHPPLALLECRLNNILDKGTITSWWSREGRTAPAEYGEELGRVSALTDDELRHAARYQFDIWCCGYNWLQSNRDSGADVRDYIENTVLAHYRNKCKLPASEVNAMKVILVTHSMGGLVGRAVTQLHGYARVLGVVNGVQPATGSSAIYHHMRCGYTWIPSLILGRNAGEVTAVVARAPGALELSPNAKYREGLPWLFVRDDFGAIRTDATGAQRAYPRADPYEEIYKNTDWYGLVPEENTQYLDMLGQTQTANNPINSTKSSRTTFEDLIDKVKEFHQDLDQAGYHQETYAHYGADDHTSKHSWRDVNWQGDPRELELPGTLLKDSGNGSYTNASAFAPTPALKVVPSRDGWESKPRDGRGGDDTVPTDSGQAPGKAGIRASFRHGNLGQGKKNKGKKSALAVFKDERTGYSHGKCFTDPRSQWATLYSIVKITQLANWHPSAKGTP